MSDKFDYSKYLIDNPLLAETMDNTGMVDFGDGSNSSTSIPNFTKSDNSLDIKDIEEKIFIFNPKQ